MNSIIFIGDWDCCCVDNWFRSEGGRNMTHLLKMKGGAKL